MVLPLLRLGPKASQRDNAIALEEIERYLNKLRLELAAIETQVGGITDGSIVLPPGEAEEVNWNEIIGIPATFPPSTHTHRETLGVVQHRDNALAARPEVYDVVLWIGTVEPLYEGSGGHAKNDDLLLLLNFME